MFSVVKNKVKEKFDNISKNKSHLFYINIDREKIWDTYLSGFEESTKQSHTCNACKSFFRQYGGIVSIENNNVVSIWDIDVTTIDAEYQKSILLVQEYIHSLPITDIFLNTFPKLGTNKNVDSKLNVIWEHFYVEIDKKFVHKGSETIDTVLGNFRDNKSVLKRSLEELTVEACENILELIAQNSLYRGKDFEAIVKQFLILKKEYNNIQDELKDNFCWVKSTEISQALCKIRNSAIGTLLIDLSKGDDLDAAVRAFEKVVAPTNYKRPAPIITSKMIEDANNRITEMGFKNSLNRRYANSSDIIVNNCLYVDRSKTLTDIFSELEKEVSVNPKTLTKVEDISITDFIEKVIPTSKSIELLLENSHLNNMVSLITSVDTESPTMFKWNNHISWSYTGGITDSIKERVKAAGGKVDGELRVSLSWFNYDDLDLHVIEPNGNKIYFSNTSSNTSGKLDVDMNAGSGNTRNAVENIIWTNKTTMLKGVYKVIVNNFAKRETSNVGFIVQVECNGIMSDFEYKISPNNKENVNVVEFEYDKINGITFKNNVKSSILSKNKWNLSTNKFHKVKNIMLSPNHWENQVGNKHYILILEDCISDEDPRPFFNEFLKEELLKEKRVFEVLGGKLKVEQDNNQLSGVAFSETIKNSFIVKVEGSFKRTLKVNI